MRTVGIKTLKNKLSEYVRLAASGETVLVTNRDKVVAELVPPREGRAQTVSDAVLADLLRRGWLTPPAVPHGSGPPPHEPLLRLSEVLEELESIRGDRI